MNSEGCREGKAEGTSQGIHRLAWVFHIRLVFFVDMKEINYSYTKYGGKVYEFLTWGGRTGISIRSKYHPCFEDKNKHIINVLITIYGIILGHFGVI